MPTTLFSELNDEKRQTIITAGITEFANYGYENSSTNRIVRNAGISKGSLFKYFPNKEDFYFYVLDKVTNELISSLEKEINNLSKELFQRIIEYSVLEFSWHIQYPEKSRLIVRAFTKDDTDIFRKTISKYGNREQDIYYWFLQNIDTDHFRCSEQKAIDILKWFLKGFNDDFRSRIQMQNNTDLEWARKEYVASLTEYLELLKAGLMK